MITLGIKSSGHDTGAAIVKNGKIIAASSEERFDRNKHSNKFPLKSIEFCLNFANIKDINDIKEIAISMDWAKRGYARYKFYNFMKVIN